MKRSCILLLLLLIFGCTEPTPTGITPEETEFAGKRGGHRVKVCHLKRNGSYVLITIARRALRSHLRHGDGRPGGSVPGMEGFIFDASCEPVLAVPTDGLVAYYPFNGNAHDESGNGNDGTVFGASLVSDRFGNFNSAYSFDGTDDRIIVNHDPSLNLGTAFTISAWVISDVTPASNNPMLAKGTAFASHEYSLFFANGSNKPWISLNGGAASNQQVGPNMGVSTTDWLHIVGLYEAGVLKLYIDGVESAAANRAAPIATTSDLRIGALQSLFYRGLIDDIRIYNRALTEAEIQVLLNEGV